MIKNEGYNLENMKKTDITDYHYLELFNEFLTIGINDVEYIDLKIKELKHRFDTLEKVELLEGEK